VIHRREDETRRTDRAADARALGESASPRRPLYLAVADPGSLERFGEQIEADDPARWPGYPAQLRQARAVTGAMHAVTTAVATVSGHACVLIGFEFAFLGGSVGEVEGGKIAAAFGLAISQGLPVVSVAASGGMRMQEGSSALAQMHVIAAAIAAARSAGIPHVAVAGNPTTGGMWASLVAAADVIIGTDCAQVSFSGSRTRPEGADPAAPEFTAEGQHAAGFLDLVVPADRLRDEVTAVLSLLSPRTRGTAPESVPLPGAVDPADPLSGWAQVSRARDEHTGTGARAEKWLADYFGNRFEILGDRAGAVDHGLRCGFGSRDGVTLGFVAQTGRPVTAAGFRTAARLIALAERFGRPVLTLIDTPGAASGPRDEAAGVGPAIAELLVAVASASVPVTSVIVGEGVSGGALALASPAALWLTAQGYLAVTSPEHAASILKLPADAVPQVAEQLMLTPADLVRLGIARGMVRQPPAKG
jgi:acetyl-CoA carboxylase beta subunit